MKPRVPASKYKKFLEFVEFLKANDAMSYFNNCHDLVLYEPNYDWIEAAFEWKRSQEGNEFWSVMHTKWNDKLHADASDSVGKFAKSGVAEK